MPSKIKQINNWTIKLRTKSDPYYNVEEVEKNYVVYSPENICMEDRLTLEEAEEYCKENKDFVSVVRIHQKQKDFINEVKEGKWFQYYTVREGMSFAKIKSLNNKLMLLWLNSSDPEGMGFCEMDSIEHWEINGEGKMRTFMIKQSFSYNFGSYEKTNSEDHIYNDKGLDENILKNVIINAQENKNFSLVTKEEIDDIWEKLKNGYNDLALLSFI